MTTTLGKYQLGPILGQGGMGTVYRSHHPLLNRPVAIKVINTQLAGQDVYRRFLREAQIVAALAHPNIIRIFDVDEQAGQPYLVMDLVERNLLDVMRTGPLNPIHVQVIGAALADALDYAHSQGIIHRDIKPANVLIRADGSPVLADFGIARPQNDPNMQVTAAGTIIGTLPYMAPEQFAATHADARSDIYALGALMYELLAGQPPFVGDTARVMHGHLYETPPPLRHDIPPGVAQLIMRMLAKRPEDRPQRGAEVAAALRSLMPAPATGATVRHSVADLPAPPKRRLLWLLPLIGVVVAVLGCVGVMAMNSAGTGRTPTPAPTSDRQISVPTISRSTPEPKPTAPGGTPVPTQPPYTGNVPGEAVDVTIGEATLEQADEIAFQRVAVAGPQAFSIGNLNIGMVGTSYWVYGELRNDTGSAREDIQLRLAFYNAEGKEVESAPGFISRGYLRQGERSPFIIILTGTPSAPAYQRFSINVDSSQADFQLGYSKRKIAIVEPLRETRSYGSIVLSGKLRNDEAEAVKSPQAILVFYDANGNVAGVSDGYADMLGEDKALGPGEEAPFDVSTTIFLSQPVRYVVFTEASSGT